MAGKDKKGTEGVEKVKKAENYAENKAKSKGQKIRNCLRKAAAFLILVLSVMQPVQTVHASNAIGTVSDFDYLSGDAKYLGQMYRNNYSLDMEETGLLDLGYILLNMLVNILFNFIWFTAFLTVTLFYICFDLNLAEMFGPQIDVVQSALNNSVFQPLFLLGCAGAFCVLLLRMWKQDLTGVLSQIFKIIGIVMLSVLVVTHSDVVLTCCTGITKEISVGMLTEGNASGGLSPDVDAFAAQGAGILWQNLIHEPWKSLEFDTESITEEDIEAFLSTSPGSEERAALVAARDYSCFKKERFLEKTGFLILYLVPFLVKCGIYLIVAVLQLVFQLLAIFYVFMAPLILIIAMFPDYERLLGIWVRKIVESQISILVLTLIISILIQFDKIIFEWSRTSQMGWLIALAIQTALALGLVYNKDKLLNLLSNVQRGIATPRFAANRLRMGGNIYQNAVPDAIKYGRKIKKQAGETIGRQAARLWTNLEEGEKLRTAPPEEASFRNDSAEGWEAAGERKEENRTVQPQYFWTWDPAKQSRIQETRSRLLENRPSSGQKRLAVNPKPPVSSGPSCGAVPESEPGKRSALSLPVAVLWEETLTEGGGQGQNNQEPLKDQNRAAGLGASSRQKDPATRQKSGQGDRLRSDPSSLEGIPKQLCRNQKTYLCDEPGDELQDRMGKIKPAAEARERISGLSVPEKYSIGEAPASGKLLMEPAPAPEIGITQGRPENQRSQAAQVPYNIPRAEIGVEKQTMKQTEYQTVKQTGKQELKQAERQKIRQTEKQAVKQAFVQTAKWTEPQAVETTKLTGNQAVETTKLTGNQAAHQAANQIAK